MARKRRTFAAKLAHARGRSKKVRKCKVCGEPIESIRIYVNTSKNTHGCAYKNKMVDVCDCNRDEIFS